MLTYLNIKDYAIIDQVELSLGNGMSALTGETGAGKSILLGALSLVLGDRAESNVVRHQTDKADISASFELQKLPRVKKWLQHHDLEADDECILRRVVNKDGRSKAFINGRPAPLTSLRELGEQLVDIHGQHEHQSLLRPGEQQNLLDDFGAYPQVLALVAQAYDNWHILRSELDELLASQSHHEKLDLLRYQVQELDALDLRASEFEELETEYQRLANGQQILNTLEGLNNLLLDDEDSIHNRLARAKQNLGDSLRFDSRLSPLAELLESTLIQTDEAATLAREYVRDIDIDPTRLTQIDERLRVIHDLARKHQVRAQALPDISAQLRNDLEKLENASQRLTELEAELKTACNNYETQALLLNKERSKAANKLSRGITQAMQDLNLSGGKFSVSVDAQPDRRPSRDGWDKVSFSVSANPGQPLQPLKKVASGGELSRISLAIQLMVSDKARIPCMIFDEVDAGIGGATAEIVGNKLAKLGKNCQVLCVTHLPQVAAQAHQHFLISKISGDKSTRTQVRALSKQDRIQEVARMLGGVELTKQSVAHAKEMIKASN